MEALYVAIVIAAVGACALMLLLLALAHPEPTLGDLLRKLRDKD